MPDAIGTPSTALKRALLKAQGNVNATAPHVEYFQALATACPEIQPAVDDLCLCHAHLDQLCRVGLGQGQPQTPNENLG